jgi:hypothetical protein
VIIYDGLMNSYNISLGPGIRRNLNQDFKEAKARHGIITSLPMSATPLPPKSPKAKPVPKPPSREEKDEALGVILGLIEQFCQEHLNDEYAVLCRKLAEKLGRKRPLAFSSRQPKCLGQRHRAGRGRGQLSARQEPDALHAVNRHRPLSRNQPK